MKKLCGNCKHIFQVPIREHRKSRPHNISSYRCNAPWAVNYCVDNISKGCKYWEQKEGK